MKSDLPVFEQWNTSEINEVFQYHEKIALTIRKSGFHTIDEALFLYPRLFWDDKSTSILESFIKENGYNDTVTTPPFLVNYRETIHFFFLLKDKIKIAPEQIAILDVGTYLGMFVSFMQDIGFTNIQGIDKSEYAIELSKRMGTKGISVCRFEIMKEQFPPNSFDIIVCLGVIEFSEKGLGEEEVFISNADAMLKPNGILILQPKNWSQTMVHTVRAFLESNNYHILLDNGWVFFAQKLE